jgi:formylglycine-generating enzyme required for sulfatase activity
MGSGDGSLEAPAWARAEFAGEHPGHLVRLTKGFWMDTTEVTVEAYAAYVAAGGYTNEALWSDRGWAWLGGEDTKALPATCAGTLAPKEPQVCVTWYEAEAYAAWRGGRLPTEAEWEFAARGPASSTYPWGDVFDAAKANLVDSDAAAAVGSFPEGASWVGAMDMAGNAMEWVADWYSATYYRQSPAEDPPGPSVTGIKIEKGGWWGAPDPAFVARSAYRHFEDPPDYQDHHIGFRVVTPG